MKALISIPDRPSRPPPLARAAYAKLLAKDRSIPIDQVTKSMRGGDDVLRVVTRAPADVATTGDGGFAAELAPTVYGEFLSWLAPDSAAARLIGMGMNYPIRGADFHAPARDTAPATLPWVAEVGAIPVRAMTLRGVEMTPRKMATMSVITREAARYGGENAIVTMLREDAAKGLDAGYFSTSAGDTTTHPGLLAGQSSLTPYGGGDQVAFNEDIGALLAVVAPNGSGNIAFVTGQYTAARIGTKFPGFKSPVFASSAVSDTRLIAVDGGALVHSAGDWDIVIGAEAAVHMEDTAPGTDIGGSTTPVRSLYQTDSWGIRIVGDVAFAGRKANVSAYIDNPNW